METTFNEKMAKIMAIILPIVVIVASVWYLVKSKKQTPVTKQLEGQIKVDEMQDQRGLGYTGQRKIVVDSSGAAYVAYRKDYHERAEIYVAKISSSQDGRTIISGTDKPAVLIDRMTDQRVPSIAIDSKGVIHLVWYGSDDFGQKNNRQIKYARSEDGGRSWSSWRNISYVSGFNESDDLWQEHPYLLVGHDDTLYVVWEGKDEKNDRQQIKFSKSLNGGNSWSRWINIVPSANFSESRPSILENRSGQLFLFMYSSVGSDNNVQQIQYSISKDTGNSWGGLFPISDPAFDARHVSAVTDDFDNIYAVWRSQVISGGPTQIMLRKFQDGAWSSSMTVAPSANYQFFPNVGIDSQGKARIVWVETSQESGFPREDPQGGQIVMATFDLGNMSEPLKVGAQDLSFYPNLPLRTKGISGFPLTYLEKSGNIYSVILKIIQ